MFRRTNDTQPLTDLPTSTDRVTSVIGPGVVWKGKLRGKGGVRIEGTLDGDINLQGLLVVGETGRVTCETLRASVVWWRGRCGVISLPRKWKKLT